LGAEITHLFFSVASLVLKVDVAADDFLEEFLVDWESVQSGEESL